MRAVADESDDLTEGMSGQGLLKVAITGNQCHPASNKHTLARFALVAALHRLPGGMAPQMALAYQLSNMGISGPPRSNPMGGMQMPPGYGPAGASAAAPMAVIGTDSKTIKIRGLPFRCVLVGNASPSFTLCLGMCRLPAGLVGPAAAAPFQWWTVSSAVASLAA